VSGGFIHLPLVAVKVASAIKGGGGGQPGPTGGQNDPAQMFQQMRHTCGRFAGGSEDRIMHMKVMKEQFVLDGDKLTHMPTGATFWLGDKDVVACEQGRLELDTGDDYDLDELKEEAWRIMVQRKAGNGNTDSHI
jgi:hypothetical protein